MGPLEYLRTQSFKLFLGKSQRTYLPLNISFGFLLNFLCMNGPEILPGLEGNDVVG